jgi:hypothetical protein
LAGLQPERALRLQNPLVFKPLASRHPLPRARAGAIFLMFLRARVVQPLPVRRQRLREARCG